MLKHKNLIVVFFLTMLLLFCFQYSYHFSFAWYLLPILAFIGIVVWGVFDIRLGFFVNTYCRNSNVKERVISITFDDGPSVFTEQFLDVLQKYNAKAAFFCVGKNIVEYPNIIRKMFDQGHIIGNHTFNHSNNTGFLNKDELLKEIYKTDEVIKEVIGSSPKLFRPPFGVTNPNIAKALKETQHSVIGWDIRSLDTIISDDEKIFLRIKKKLKPGSIILLHDTSIKSLQSLERLLQYLLESDYKIITLDKLLNIKAYEN